MTIFISGSYRKFAKLSLSCAAIISLSGCVTSGSSAPPEQIQSSITNASMMTESASCSQISQSIRNMDQIIVSTTGNATQTYNASNNTFSGTKQTINNKLYQSDAYRENIGIASDIMRAVTGGNTSASSSTQLEKQQSQNAQNEKNRLIGLYQNKKCTG